MVELIHDRVLLDVENTETVISGIIIPDMSVTKSQFATVIATGPGYPDSNGIFPELDVKVGDNVLIRKSGDMEVAIDGKQYVLSRQSDILAVFDK